VDYEQAVEHATAALKAEGFGVLTTIDVKNTLEKKLDKGFRRYTILGACNPPLAFQALEAELEIGLLLPCNVIVYESGPGKSVVAAMAPLEAMGVVGNPRWSRWPNRRTPNFGMRWLRSRTRWRRRDGLSLASRIRRGVAAAADRHPAAPGRAHLSAPVLPRRGSTQSDRTSEGRNSVTSDE
jgi:hypothetical protein